MEEIKKLINSIERCFPKEIQTDYIKGYFDGMKLILDVFEQNKNPLQEED